MMAAGDLRLLFSQQCGQRAAGHNGYPVAGPVVGGLLLVGGGVHLFLAGQVLPEGASQRHIDQLDAPADPKYRLACLQCGPEQPQLHLIPAGHHQPAGGQLLLSIESGRHIRPSGEQNAVAQSRQLRQIVRVPGQGQHQRQGSCLLQRIEIRGHHPIAVPLHIHQRHKANDRFFHILYFPSQS